MNTECYKKKIEFQDLGQRKLVADFSAGHITSDAGGLVLKEIEGRRGLIPKVFPLAGKSTLNRIELSLHKSKQPLMENDSMRPSRIDRKIVCHPELIKDFFVQAFLGSYKKPPEEIILDFDATDDPLHGNQEGRFFHGYYRGYCYLPLYVFCGDHLLVALRLHIPSGLNLPSSLGIRVSLTREG